MWMVNRMEKKKSVKVRKAATVGTRRWKTAVQKWCLHCKSFYTTENEQGMERKKKKEERQEQRASSTRRVHVHKHAHTHTLPLNERNIQIHAASHELFREYKE